MLQICDTRSSQPSDIGSRPPSFRWGRTRKTIFMVFHSRYPVASGSPITTMQLAAAVGNHHRRLPQVLEFCGRVRAHEVDWFRAVVIPPSGIVHSNK